MTVIDHAGKHELYNCGSLRACRHRANFGGVDYCSQKLLLERALVSFNVIKK